MWTLFIRKLTRVQFDTIFHAFGFPKSIRFAFKFRWKTILVGDLNLERFRRESGANRWEVTPPTLRQAFGGEERYAQETGMQGRLHRKQRWRAACKRIKCARSAHADSSVCIYIYIYV